MGGENGQLREGRRAPAALIVAAAAIVALGLRTYRSDGPFQSGDYATIPYMVSHWYGVSWIIAHTYGPLLAALAWVFARTVVGLGLVMNEAMWRLPLAMVGTIQVPVTYFLMRRLGAGRWGATMAAGLAAVLPSLTSDGRYPWGYESLGVCVGSLAVWAWLRDLDHSTRASRWLAGGLLGLYLLSHLVIYAVPLVILAAVLIETGRGGTMRRLLRPSTLVPVCSAVGITLFAFWGLGGGILGRLSRHAARGTLEVGGSSLVDIAGHWNHHLGPIWATFCLLAVIVGLARLVRGDRRGLPALWAVVYVLPLALLLDPSKIGRATMYHIQGTYAASLAGCMLVEMILGASASAGRPFRMVLRGWMSAFCIAIIGLQTLGSVSNLFLSHRRAWASGTVDYGRAVADPGSKAAGWYVRTHVPAEATILATHGTSGMEYPCATYYTGRHVAAAEDTTFEQECAIIEAVRGDIDVAIVEPRYLSLFSDRPDFTVPVRIIREGKPILHIAARRRFEIPEMDVEVVRANRLYDRDCSLRRVPTMIRELPRTSAANRTILALLRGQEAAPESVAVSGDDVD